MLQADHKNTVVLIFRHIQCLHLTYAKAAWVLVSSGTQVQPQILLDPDYLPDYLSVFSECLNLFHHAFFVPKALAVASRG